MTPQPQLKKDEYTHMLIAVCMPSDGHFVFVCSSSPKTALRAYGRILRCPLCKAFNPLQESR